MTIQLNGDTGITTPMYNGSITANPVTPSVNMKNRIINGAMVLAQYGTGSTSVQTTSDYCSCDRWKIGASVNSKYTIQQSSTAPTGFNYSLLATSSSAYTVGAAENFTIQQRIEGFNTADLGFGTATAKTVTLSFWVQSSLTGTFGGSLCNSAFNRTYPFTYTISSANTWTQISVTIAGDTSGTWIGATNGVGIIVYFNLGAGSNFTGTNNAWNSGFYLGGSTSVVGTSGATFYITGVQLEVGSSSSSYDVRSYGTELALCQRYCINYKSSDGGVYYRYSNGYNVSAGSAEFTFQFLVAMRSSPSLTTTGTSANYAIYTSGGINSCNAGPVIDNSSKGILSATINAGTASTLTNGQGSGIISNNNTTSYLLFTAEL